jgi:hypothetical protein
MSMLLTLLFTCLTFSVSVSLDFLFTTHAFFPERLSNRSTVSVTCAKCDAHSLSDPSRNRIRPDTRLKIRSEHQHIRPAAWNFVYWLQIFASTTIYWCIAQIQLLYSWQHQSRKLWILSLITSSQTYRSCTTFRYGVQLRNIINKQSRTTDKVWSPRLYYLNVGLKNPYRK